MCKHTTSGFCPQGHLVSDWLAPVEAKEGSCRGQRRAAVEDWLNEALEEEACAELGKRGTPLDGVSGK